MSRPTLHNAQPSSVPILECDDSVAVPKRSCPIEERDPINPQVDRLFNTITPADDELTHRIIP